MKKTFTIKPLGGLCNCLRVLLSCADYCDDMGYNLLCIWNSWQNNVHFTDFFKNIKGVSFTDSYQGHVDYESCFEISATGKEIRSRDFTANLSQLKLKDEIQTKINELPIARESFISCHVRRGDHTKIYRNLSYYYKLIDSSTYNFIHLCTDDPHIQNEFSARYKDKLWYYEKITKNKSTLRNTSSLSTIIDLFLPLHAKDFIGTKGSSFTSFIQKSRNELS